MLSPSDFNNAVPQFTNGDYASNPINPQYIAEPDSVNYNRGAEPLQTLPAQWWNWFLNKFTAKFNKINIYVKNIFNELTQLLSLVSVTPSGTEGSPTVGQLKDMFETKYPDYLKTTPALSNTYVTQTTKVNGHALSDNVTVTRSDLGLGTSATLDAGSAVGNVPVVGTALGTTNGNILMTDANGKLKPSGITTGTSAGNIPLIGTALGATNNNIVVTDANGKLKSSGTVIGSAAGKTAGASAGNVPLVGTALGTTNNNIVVTDTSGQLKPSGTTIGSAAGKTAGSAVGNVPLVGTALGTTNNNILVTDTSGNIKPSGTVIGSSAGKTAGSAVGNVPLIGTALGSTNNNIVVTDTSGQLKPSGTTIGSAAGKTAGSASGNVPLNGAALGTTDGNIIVTNASGALKGSGETVASLKTYIKNQNILDGMEDISLPNTTSYSAALEVSYDGVLYVTQNEYGVAVRIWSDSSTNFMFNEVWGNNKIGHAFSIPFKKGDRFSMEYYGSAPTVKVRYYKNRDYTGR